jgi:MtfA peptidase
MLKWLEDCRRKRVLSRFPIADLVWDQSLSRLPILQGLTSVELVRLRELTTLFLHEKHFSSADGMRLTARMRAHVAVQACLPLLGLDWRLYRGWSEVILYPAEFLPRHEYTDEAGVVHVTRDVMVGEAWAGGPVVLSWSDAESSGQGTGINVVLHEFAHKLDMLNGDTNGLPPLHADMRVKDWAEAFEPAYEDFCSRIDAGNDTLIDPYAGESPGEFFAVSTEVFFETPEVLVAEYPVVYAQLCRFYRQDPVRRRSR